MTEADKKQKVKRQKERRQEKPSYGRQLRLVLKAQGLDYHVVYAERLKAQGGVCAICGKPPGKTRLALDHCHRTGRVRGLLCWSCNVKLGWLEKRMGAIVRYLKEYK